MIQPKEEKQKYIYKEGYSSKGSIKDTEIAIKQVKDFFERSLAKNLNLTRVTAPLFVYSFTGINDNLNGTERPVVFDSPDLDGQVEIVHSLAKWKRQALGSYGFKVGEGLYTDMNAIRRDEELDHLHSIYVDQWDYEVIIDKKERTMEKLQQTVSKIYESFKDTEKYLHGLYPELVPILPEEIFFITSQQLEDLYPELSPKQREEKITVEKKAVFLMQIGGALRSGQPHDGRSPDYDDWSLNGDILVYHPVLESSIELSSMGIRVDEEALLKQLKIRGMEERLKLDFHKKLLAGELPYTLGGGIGQSRLCMFFLRKLHVGEVQVSLWPGAMVEFYREKGVRLL